MTGALTADSLMEPATPSSEPRYNRAGALLCAGVQRKSRQPCSNPAVRGRRYCRVHGGRVPVGPASGQWKHGKYSRALGNTPLAEMFELGRSDPELLSLREHISAWDARIEQLLQRLGPDSAANWQQTQQLFRTWQEIDGAEGMAAAALAAKQAFERALFEGATAEGTWNKLLQVGDAVRKFREAEIKREAALHQTFTVSNATAFASAMSALAREYIPPDRLAQFVSELRMLTLNAIDTRQEPRRPEVRAGN